MTFREFCENQKLRAAESVFRKALLASNLAHLAIRQKRRRSAKTLRRLKTKCVERALELAPNIIKTTIDAHYQIGLPSIQWPGVGRLHLLNGQLGPYAATGPKRRNHGNDGKQAA